MKCAIKELQYMTSIIIDFLLKKQIKKIKLKLQNNFSKKKLN